MEIEVTLDIKGFLADLSNKHTIDGRLSKDTVLELVTAHIYPKENTTELKENK